MTPVRLEPAALRSRVKHSTTEPLRSLVSACADKLDFKCLLLANVFFFCIQTHLTQTDSVLEKLILKFSADDNKSMHQHPKSSLCIAWGIQNNQSRHFFCSNTFLPQMTKLKCTKDIRLISVVDVVITPMNPYQPIPFHILTFAVFESRILIYASSTSTTYELYQMR